MIEMMVLAQADTTTAMAAATVKTAEAPKATSTLDTMFGEVKAFGTLRAAWIDQQGYLSNPDTTATAFGGRFGFDTAESGGLSVHAAAYAGFNIAALGVKAQESQFNNEYTGNKNSFIYLAEANIAYTNEQLQFAAGRISIDTPYADSDDIRMAPNTFEGAVAAIQAGEDLSINLAFLNRWAGFDSVDALEQDVFKPLVSSASYGALAIAFVKSFGEFEDLSIWYYDVDNLASILYGEYCANTAIGDALELEYALQASAMSQRANSGVNGTAYGASAALIYKGFGFGAAYNRATAFGGGVIIDGFGGGPYLSSMDEMTLGTLSEMAPGEQLGSYMVGMGYAFEKGSLAGLGFDFAHAEFESENSTAKVREDDIIVSYEAGEHWALEAVYAHFNDLRTSDNTFERSYLRVDYSF